MDAKTILKKLYEKFPDLEICFYNEKYTESNGWGKWKKFVDVGYNISYETARLYRTVLPIEMTLDIEDKKHTEKIKEKLLSLGFKFKIYDTGGRGVHFHWFMEELKKYDKSILPHIKKYVMEMICEKNKFDPKKRDNRTLIGAEYFYHRNSKNKKTLLFETDSEIYPNNRLPQNVLNYIKEGLPEKFEGNIRDDIVATVVFKDKEPCEAIQNLIQKGQKHPNRNHWANLIVQQLRDYCGLTFEECFEIIKKYNQNCNPPKKEDIIKRDLVEQYAREYGINCNTLCDYCPYAKEGDEINCPKQLGFSNISDVCFDELSDKQKETTIQTKSKLLYPKKINFLDTKFYDTWDKVKSRAIKLSKSHNKLIFLAHTKHTITGKAQLMFDVKKSIPLMSKLEKEIVIKSGDAKGEKLKVHSYRFLDDNYDRRKDGYQIDCFDYDFWIYKICDEGKEYLILSPDKIAGEECTFTGMKIKMTDFTELSKNLKLRSITTIFILDKVKPTIQNLSKEEMVALSLKMKTDYGLDPEEIINFIFTNPQDNKIYRYNGYFDKLILSQLFSGEFEGYPLHLLIMGIVGTGKTKLLECLDKIFQEEQGICEGANSTLKGLVPSFKEKPANPGYILKCIRMSLIDELMKLIEGVLNQTQSKEILSDYFAKLNMLFEHKKRMLVSGNDNSFYAQCTSKVIAATNPLVGRNQFVSHVDIIGQTTLSRLISYIQGKEFMEKIREKPPEENESSCAITHRDKYMKNKKNKKNYIFSYTCVIAKNMINLYSNCQNFLISEDKKNTKDVFLEVKNSLKNQPFSIQQMWLARGLHHTTLLLDGIVKFRCLFKDYNPDFTATEEDYTELRDLLKHITGTWNIQFEPFTSIENIEENTIYIDNTKSKVVKKREKPIKVDKNQKELEDKIDFMKKIEKQK